MQRNVTIYVATPVYLPTTYYARELFISSQSILVRFIAKLLQAFLFYYSNFVRLSLPRAEGLLQDLYYLEFDCLFGLVLGY